MGKPLFIADPLVAAHYNAHPGEWVHIADDAEADWLVEQRHAYGLNGAIPSAGHVDPAAPAFVPYGTVKAPAKAKRARKDDDDA